MSFLHCHTKGCNWEQDDFYSPDGYPLSFLKDWMKELCDLNVDIEKQFSTDSNFIAEHGPISKREVIAQEFEKFGDRIRNMPWPTWEHWQKEKDTAVCPKCGERNWDID